MVLVPVLLLALALAAAVGLDAGPPPPSGSNNNGTVTNASQILGKIPLKQLRLIVPSTPVSKGSQAAVTLVFSRSVIRLGSDWDTNGDSGTTTVNGVHPLLWSCNGGSPHGSAHGPPISGRTWWVTTAILRFDPTEDWGNDLRCTVRANPLLRSWDGARLLPWTGKASGFNTTQLAIGNVAVSSAMAAAATDGKWRSKLSEGYQPHEVDECPSDCLINITLSNSPETGITAATLEKHLCLVRNASEWSDTCRRVQVSKRPGLNAAFTIVPPPLSFDTVYNLTLPKGVVVSNTSGPTTKSLTIQFSGLRPFEFAYIQNNRYTRSPAIDNTQVSLFVRHGLPLDTPESQIQQAVAVAGPHKSQLPVVVRRKHNDVTLNPSKTELRVLAKFRPSTDKGPPPYSSGLQNYTFTSGAGRLKDAFGLTLQPGEGTFSTAKLTTFFVQPDAFGAYARDDPIDLVALARGEELIPPSAQHDRDQCTGVKLRAAPVHPHQLTTILMLAYLNCSNTTAEHAVFLPGVTKEFGPAPATSEVQKWKFGELGGDSSWVLIQKSKVKGSWQSKCELPDVYTNERDSCALYTAASFSVTSFSDSGSLMALVTSNSDATPVVGAQVSLFELRGRNDNCRDCSKCLCAEVNKVDQLTTDAHGLAVFPASVVHTAEQYPYLRYIAVAQHDGEMNLAPPQTVQEVRKLQKDLVVLVGDTIVDRALYDGGDTMHITGILRAYDWQGQNVPLPTFKPGSPTPVGKTVCQGHAVCQTPWGSACVQADQFGVVSCIMDVPTNASHGEYTVQLLTPSESPSGSEVRSYQGSVQVTIADPRHPAAVLYASTTTLLVNPEQDSVLKLNITCATYLGDKVKNAAVQITWQGTTGGGADQVTRSGEYTLVLPTGAESNMPLRLPRHLMRNLVIGTTLSIKVSWLDATRDLLTKTLVVPVKLSAWTLYVETNPPDNRIFAGFPFRATGVVRVPDAVQIDPENPPHIELSLVQVDADGRQNSSAVTTVSEPLASTPRFYPGSCPYDPEGDCNSRHEPALNEWTFSHSVEMTMPTVDHYQLVARVVDNLGQHLNSTLEFGRNETEQALQVLMGWKQTFWGLYLDNADVDLGYIVGDTATVHWHNPLDKDVRVLLMWGNGGLKERQRQHLTVPHGAVKFNIPLGEECTGGCDVQAFVYFGSQEEAKLPVAQPKSQLFDLALPGAALLPSLHIAVGLDVPTTTGIAKLTITPPEHAVANENVTISFDVTDEQGLPAVAGELVVYVVDEALLDLLPYDIPVLACAAPYRPFYNYAPDVSLTSSIATLSSEHNVAQALKSTEWRIATNPYTDAKNWGVRACQGPLDIVDNLFMDSAVTPITYGLGSDQLGASSWLTGGCGGHPPPGPPAPNPSPSPGGGGGGHHRHPNGKGGKSHPSVRKTYAATAFYQSNVVVKGGKATVQFTMPENLGTWRVSAVAVTTSAGAKHTRTVQEYVKGETTFVSRLPVSLEPSMPLIGRVGEQFTGGCVVDALAPGRVQLTIMQHDSSHGSLNIKSPSSQVVTVKPGEPKEVLWSFEVDAIGEAALQFTAVSLDHSTSGDAFVYDLPLLAIQQPVTLSTSFDLLANHSFNRWTEGFAFPPAVPKSGSLSVAAGIGHYPSQCVLQQRIDETVSTGLKRPRHQWPDVFALIAALAPPAVMHAYAQENVTANVILQLALLALRTEYTNSNGLQQIPARYLVYPSFPSVAPNAFALRVHREVTSEFNTSVAAQVFRGSDAQSALREWENAIVSALRSWRQVPYGESEWEPTPSWWAELALGYFGLGKSFPLDKQYGMTNASVEALKVNARLCSFEQQAMISLVLLETNVTDSDRKLVEELSAQWYNNLRVQDGTAYVAENGGASALSMGTQALILHVFALIKPTEPLVEELANYVAMGPSVGSSINRWYSSSDQDATYSSFALAAFDKAVGSAVPDLAVFVAKGDGSPLFNASFRNGAAPAVHNDYTFAQLGHTKRLQFYALGTGEASVALSADFIPAQLEVRPVFFGLFVQKSLCLINADGTFTAVDLSDKEYPLQPGQIVQVTVSVTSADSLPDGVVVYDPLPAALQAQDPLLKANRNVKATKLGSSSNSTVAANRSSLGGLEVAGITQYWGNSEYNPYSWFPDAPWRWGFSQMDVFHDHVSCLTPFFGAGTSECIYTAEVVTSGVAFVLPPAHAFVPTHPGTMGLSGTAHFAVAERQV